MSETIEKEKNCGNCKYRSNLGFEHELEYETCNKILHEGEGGSEFAHTQDAECYASGLEVRKDFYCNQWVSNVQK